MASDQPMTCKICRSAEVAHLYRVRRPDELFDVLICNECGMHFIDYLDPPAIADPPATPENVEDTAVAVASGLESNSERIDRNIAMLKQYAPSGAVLDVGSGGGGFLTRIKDAYDRVVGLELDPPYISLARARGLEIVNRPLEDPYWDNHQESFDAITLWDVIEHVNDPLEICERAHALLKPNGVLLIDTPNRDGFFYRFGELTARLTGGRILSTMGTQYSSSPFCHKQIFRKADMHRLLRRAGFSKVTLLERFELSLPTDFYMRRFVRSQSLRKLANPIAEAAFKVLPIRNKLIVAAAR
jgi:2-polyprenyl-6-hydroxyphenyl methylase/3-demethylubiquinone-9 3-methyltransferase